MVIRGFSYVVVFYITLILFLPKNEIVLYIDNKFLSKNEVKQNIQLENKIFGYSALNSRLMYQGNSIAQIKSIEINPYLVYNSIEISRIKLEGIVGGFFPSEIDKASIVYNITNPTKLSITIKGDFGNATGYLDIVAMKIHFEVVPSALMKKGYSFILNNMKKSNEIYIYEYKL